MPNTNDNVSETDAAQAQADAEEAWLARHRRINGIHRFLTRGYRPNPRRYRVGAGHARVCSMCGGTEGMPGQDVDPHTPVLVQRLSLHNRASRRVVGSALVCPACYAKAQEMANEMDAGGRVCSSCGERLPQFPVDLPRDRARCDDCNTHIDTCARCGTMHPNAQLRDRPQGDDVHGRLCEPCWLQVYSECAVCGQVHRRTDMTQMPPTTPNVRRYVCRTCLATDAVTQCPSCDVYTLPAEMRVGVDGVPRCPSCHARTHRTCHDCGEERLAMNGVNLPDGAWACSECRVNYVTCPDCGRFMRSGELCRACRRSIHNYSYRPGGGWVTRMTEAEASRRNKLESKYLSALHDAEVRAADRAKRAFAPHKVPEHVLSSIIDLAKQSVDFPTATMCMGFELEVSLGTNSELTAEYGHDEWHDDIDEYCKKCAEELTAEYGEDGRYMFCKEDGSVDNGFEIVSHPTSFDMFRTPEMREKMAGLLKYLRSKNFSGHNYGGMHVHVTRAAFSKAHLYKFNQLFRNNKELWFTISQRKRDDLDQYANLRDEGFIRYGNIKSIHKHTSGNRYICLNHTRNTIELRLFNSSIRDDRFWKNIEAVQAAFDYSRDYGLRDMYAIGFMQYIVENKGRFPNLLAFLCESGNLNSNEVGLAGWYASRARKATGQYAARSAFDLTPTPEPAPTPEPVPTTVPTPDAGLSWAEVWRAQSEPVPTTVPTPDAGLSWAEVWRAQSEPVPTTVPSPTSMYEPVAAVSWDFSVPVVPIPAPPPEPAPPPVMTARELFVSLYGPGLQGTRAFAEA